MYIIHACESYQHVTRPGAQRVLDYLLRLVVLDGDDTGEAEPVDDRLPRFLALWLRAAEDVASWPPSVKNNTIFLECLRSHAHKIISTMYDSDCDRD